jgi:glutamate--cysteine ligase
MASVPSDSGLVTTDDAHSYVGRICFRTGPPRFVGAELEWLVADPTDPYRRVSLDRLREIVEAAGPLPGGGRVTYEPGGQLELSSAPGDGLNDCWRRVELDAQHLRAALARANLTVLPSAIDPYREPHRQLVDPRYAAMEAYFDLRGGNGRVMMCCTTAVQVNLDAGADPTDVARRWKLLNRLGPTMVAAFANSPVQAGRVTGWKSSRQLVWQLLDPSRTSVPLGDDPIASWTDYALDAAVMLRRTTSPPWTVNPGLTFREWIERGDDRPSEDDLEYHLSTLFPPVRPRGWLEVRYVDAQPDGLWPVPLAVLTALVEDPQAAAEALDAVDGLGGRWIQAARHGLAIPELARAASDCFTAALAALPRLGADPTLVDLVGNFAERYVLRARCPADDVLDEGSFSPTTEELV